jgi:hypothetical protein
MLRKSYLPAILIISVVPALLPGVAIAGRGGGHAAHASSGGHAVHVSRGGHAAHVSPVGHAARIRTGAARWAVELYMDILAGGIKICKVGNRALLRLGDATQDRHLGVFGAFVAARISALIRSPTSLTRDSCSTARPGAAPRILSDSPSCTAPTAAICAAPRRLSRRLRAFNTLRRRWS